MNLILKLAIRNLSRNRRRTLITAAVMTIGLAGLIFVDGFLSGLVNTMIESATTTMLGDWQIHQGLQTSQNKTNSLDSYLENLPLLEKNLIENKNQITWAKRIVTDGMASAAEFSGHVQIYGISPEEEKKTSRILNHVIAGTDFTNEGSAEPEIMIGKELAENLNVRAGEHLVLVSSGFQNFGMTQDRFKICGIFKSGARRIDQFVVLLNIPVARTFLHLPNEIYHEIAIHSLSPELRRTPEIFKLEVGNNNKLRSWKELIPALEAGINITTFSRLVYSIVLLFLTLLTVTNAILMSIYERLYEMGVIKAIGTKPRFIFKLILCETLILSLFSALSGMALGFLLILVFQKNGIPFGEIEYFGTSITQGIVPLFQPIQFTVYPVFIIVAAIIASLYPAYYASQINALKALRRE